MKERHRSQAKANKRRRDKLERRKKAIKLMDCSPASRQAIQGCLRLDMTSPEKSDEEGTRVRLPFVWESSRLCQAKEKLDDSYRFDVLKTDGARRQLVFVKDGSQETATPPPPNCPQWAISRDYN